MGLSGDRWAGGVHIQSGVLKIRNRLQFQDEAVIAVFLQVR